MQLSANKIAQFFIQNAIPSGWTDGSRLLLSSVGSEERIPFTIGRQDRDQTRIVLWSLQFFANQQDGKQRSWLVQGLPGIWRRVSTAVHLWRRQKWHDTQCEQLAEHVPQWEAELLREQLPAFLPHSKVNTAEKVNLGPRVWRWLWTKAKSSACQRIARMQP